MVIQWWLMQNRQRVVISVPPDVARECRKIAKAKGETMSQLSRDMLLSYKQEKMKDDFYQKQALHSALNNRVSAPMRFHENNFSNMYNKRGWAQAIP